MLTVGLIGHGALGSALSDLICRPEEAALRLGGVLDASSDGPEPVRDIEELLERSDVVVEAAGPQALHQYTSTILASGRTLVACSVGAFLHENLWNLLVAEDHAQQIILSTGALGGLDLLRATNLADPTVAVTLKSRKKPRSLIQQWMPRDDVQRLVSLGASDPSVVVFAGQAREAAELFPANLNVAAALALAVGDPDRVTVELTADPQATMTTHQIEIESSLGSSSFALRNKPLPRNPATSAVVPWAVLRCLKDLASSLHPRFV